MTVNTNDVTEFVGGTRYTLTINIVDDDSLPVAINTASYVGLKMWPFGQSSGSATLTITGSLSGSPTNQYKAIFQNSDTQNLSGVYVYQTIIIDNSGADFIYQPGIINIVPRIA